MDALISKLPLAEAFEAEYLTSNGILPLEIAGDRLRVAVAGAPDSDVLDDLEATFGLALDLISVTQETLEDGVRRSLNAAKTVAELVLDLSVGEPAAAEPAEAQLADARGLASQPPVIQFVNLLIREAHDTNASDIHLESSPTGLRVRMRLDGVLQDVAGPPRSLQAAVISCVKLIAEMDIAERRRAQDGRFRIRLEERDLDVRVSTVPTLHGESLVLRLLERGGRSVTLEELGLGPEELAMVQRLAMRPHGLILATGPTGSGKTTTLYAALAMRDLANEKTITIEDPVEYHLPGVTQVPVDRRTGMTFAGALRTILRQDPDVLMVGEMRDAETAQLAVQAAVTGHLVYSTVHTNDATAAVDRLRNLGVEPFLIAAALEAVLAQRLVRRICPDCRDAYQPDPSSVSLLAGRPVGSLTLFRGTGCPACRGTGFKGRIGLFELFVVSPDAVTSIASGDTAARMRRSAQQSGMITLRQDGWRKVQAGITTVEEVLRVTQE